MLRLSFKRDRALSHTSSQRSRSIHSIQTGISVSLFLGVTFFLGTIPGSGTLWAGTLSRQQAQLPQQPEETSIPGADDPDDDRFSCQFVNSEYTVMYHPQSQPGQSYAWATPTALGGGWTPERRCNEIARRLEFYRPDGLVELGTGIENEYDIICVTTQADASCRIVLTVPPGQDPQQTRDLVFQNIVTADSGQSTAAVSALTANGEEVDLLEEVLGIDLSQIEVETRNPPNRINLQPFLDEADGGTGEMLEDGISTSPNPKLNPENFR